MSPRRLVLIPFVLAAIFVSPLRLWAQDRLVIPIWPEGVPGLRADASPAKVDGGHVSNVHWPTLTEFAPMQGRANGTAIIICPGGSYTRLAFDHEGVQPALWLQSLGVTAFVLQYRMREYGHPAPLRDVLRAIRFVRSRAAGFGIRADRIGVMGSSAGGHLAASASTLYDAPEGRTGAALDKTSGRPDFALLLYPVITFYPPYAHAGSVLSLLGPDPAPELLRHLSLELQVDDRTPPIFIVQGEDDKSVPMENSVKFYLALRRAGVPAELHLFAHGPHGFGLAREPGLGPVSAWPRLAEAWMRSHGWLP